MSPLLARRVPDLELDAQAVELDLLDLEVDADRRDEGGAEGVVGVAQEQRGLADGACVVWCGCPGVRRDRPVSTPARAVADHQQFAHADFI